MKLRQITAVMSIGLFGVLLGAACNVEPQPVPNSAANQAVTNDKAIASVDSSVEKQPADPLIKPFNVPGYVPAWTPNDTYSIDHFVSVTDEFAHDNNAHFHAHGQKVCASGCATSNHPTDKLTREHFFELLDQYATQPMTRESMALERLTYFGRQARNFIEEEGYGPLDTVRSRFLWNELSRTHARISLRVVDEHGEIRSWLDSTQVPFDRRHVFDMQTKRVQPLMTSGTVKRVGLDHLWTRL